MARQLAEPHGLRGRDAGHVDAAPLLGSLSRQRRRGVAPIYMDAGALPDRAVGHRASRGPRRARPRVPAPRRRRRSGDGLVRESAHRRPVIATDGFCPRCGRPAPLTAYAETAAPLGRAPRRRRHAGARRPRARTPDSRAPYGTAAAARCRGTASVGRRDRRRLAGQGVRRAARGPRGQQRRRLAVRGDERRRACTAARRRWPRFTPRRTRSP